MLTGDRLAMMPGAVLLAESRLFAPDTLRAAQASNPHLSDAWLTDADVVFLRHHRPGDVADALGGLCRTAAMAHGRSVRSSSAALTMVER